MQTGGRPTGQWVVEMIEKPDGIVLTAPALGKPIR
jgi:hypothetical protein